MNSINRIQNPGIINRLLGGSLKTRLALGVIVASIAFGFPFPAIFSVFAPEVKIPNGEIDVFSKTDDKCNTLQKAAIVNISSPFGIMPKFWVEDLSGQKPVSILSNGSKYMVRGYDISEEGKRTLVIKEQYSDPAVLKYLIPGADEAGVVALPSWTDGNCDIAK